VSGMRTAVRWDLHRYGRRLVVLIVVTAIGTTAVLFAQSLISSGSSHIEHRDLEGAALRTITVRTRPDRPDAPALDDAAVRQLSQIDGVAEVDPLYLSSFAVKELDLEQVFTAASVRTVLPPPIVVEANSSPLPLQAGDALLPATINGVDLRPYLGKSLPADFTRKVEANGGVQYRHTLTVVGLYDPGYVEDGPGVAYLAQSDLREAVAARGGFSADNPGAQVTYNEILVVATDRASTGSVEKAGQAQGYNGVSLDRAIQGLPSSLRALELLSRILVVVLLLALLLLGASLINTAISDRSREIGILKSIGFSSRQINRLFLIELAVIGAGTAVVATTVATLVVAAIGSRLANHAFAGADLAAWPLVPPAAWLAFCLAIPIVGVVVGGLRPARRAARLEPDIALREW